MTPIDPSTIAGLPAPFWFVLLFKIIGFVLHCVPMAIWFVGLPLALFFYCSRGGHARRFSRRIFLQLPIVMALGINFGIVPLLFIQTAYFKAFYTSSILMAVHWFAILGLVMVAYYSIYLCSFMVGRPRNFKFIGVALLAMSAIWCAGLIFSSQWSLMESPDQWIPIWEKTQIGGAVTGLGSWWKPVVFVRWTTMLGISLITLGFWAFFDAWILCRRRSFSPLPGGDSGSFFQKGSGEISGGLSKKERRKLRKGAGVSDEQFEAEYAALEAAEREEQKKRGTGAKSGSGGSDSIDDYRRWALSLALNLSWLGFLIAAAASEFYFSRYVTADDPNLAYLFATPWKYLLWTGFGALALPALILTFGKWRNIRGTLLVLPLLVSEILMLASFAAIRQLLQNGKLADYLRPETITEAVEWNPLFTFLGVFVFTLLVIIWMIHQMVASGHPDYDSQG